MEQVGRTIKYDGFSSQFRSLALNQVGYEVCDPNQSYGPAIRDYYLFHYVIDGCGIYKVNDKEYVIRKDMIFMIPPDEMTTYTADEKTPWTYYWIGFSGLEAKKLIQLAGFNKQRLVMDYMVDELKVEEKLFELIRKLAIKRIRHESDKIEEISRLYKVISLLRKNYENSIAIYEEDEQLNSHVRTAIDYILKNYTMPITVENIASYVGIDRTRLYRLFEDTYNIGPKEYVITYRLKKAEELLKSTDMTIKSVSYSVGYLDQYLFSKIFKKYYGVSPKVYRNNNSKTISYSKGT